MDKIINEEDLGFNLEPKMTRIYAKQYDTDRVLQFELMDDVSLLDMSDVSYIYWREKFADGTILPPVFIDLSNLTNNGSRLSVPLTRDMLSITGIAKCDVVFIKGASAPTFDPDTHELESSGNAVLSSQTFEIYIDETPYKDGCVPTGTSSFDDLVTLILAMQIAQENEEERIRAEQERVAREGIGTYQDYEFRIPYVDASGVQHYIEYQDSRVGRNERIKALNEGGYYIDENGDLQNAKNEYVDGHGDTQTADLSDLEEMSFMAVAAQAKAVAGDPTYALLAESHSHGNTGVRSGEDTDNAEYWNTQAQAAANRAETALAQVEDVQESTVPTYSYDPNTGHLYYTGSHSDISVNNTTGHLIWTVTSDGSDSSSEIIEDIISRLGDLEAALDLTQ